MKDYDKIEVLVNFKPKTAYTWVCPDCNEINAVYDPWCHDWVTCAWCDCMFGIGEAEE
jgi:hypothetical protein